MKENWNKRYSNDIYFYGKSPNQFFAETISGIKPGKALFVGEGEGRNSVHAAKLGWDVDALDYSEQGRSKAIKLAKTNNVEIKYSVIDLRNFEIKKNYYDLIVIVFLHMAPIDRNTLNQKLIQSLAAGGELIMEVFDKEQINNNSGGPRNVDLLYSLEEIVTVFQDLDFVLLEKIKTSLSEGEHHEGSADVIRFIGKKIN